MKFKESMIKSKSSIKRIDLDDIKANFLTDAKPQGKDIKNNNTSKKDEKELLNKSTKTTEKSKTKNYKSTTNTTTYKSDNKTITSSKVNSKKANAKSKTNKGNKKTKSSKKKILDVFLSDKKTLILKTYNSVSTIGNLINSVLSLHGNFSIIVIDNCSDDGTIKVLEKLSSMYTKHLQVIKNTETENNTNPFLQGLKLAIEQKSDYIFLMNSDSSHNEDDLLRLYWSCKDDDKYSIAVGSRYLKYTNIINCKLWKIITMYFLNKYISIITGMNLTDLTSTFACFKREVLEKIDFDSKEFQSKNLLLNSTCNVKIKFQALQNNFKIKEIPIIYREPLAKKHYYSKKDKFRAITNQLVIGSILLRIKSINKSITSIFK